ncbi:hypothetical protein T439DRAFT_348442 [Meredithblackwellia eburnea MCA 4105]
MDSDTIQQTNRVPDEPPPSESALKVSPENDLFCHICKPRAQCYNHKFLNLSHHWDGDEYKAKYVFVYRKPGRQPGSKSITSCPPPVKRDGKDFGCPFKDCIKAFTRKTNLNKHWMDQHEGKSAPSLASGFEQEGERTNNPVGEGSESRRETSKTYIYPVAESILSGHVSTKPAGRHAGMPKSSNGVWPPDLFSSLSKAERRRRVCLCEPRARWLPVS